MRAAPCGKKIIVALTADALHAETSMLCVRQIHLPPQEPLAED